MNNGTMTIMKRAVLRNLTAGGLLVLATLVFGQVFAAPTVSLTAPTANAAFASPANITLTANASPSSGTTLRQVAFYRGSTLIATIKTAPYTYAWTNVAAGSYSLTAKATDSKNATTTSKAVPVVVSAAPTVKLTAPTANAVFAAPASIPLTASATDSDGTITKVEFYRGTTLIATDTTSPYTATWANAPAGSYSLTAKATDNQGVVSTSPAVPVKVNALPTVTLTSPTANQTVLAQSTVTLTANATDTDGTIARVEFYQGTTLIGSATSAPYTVAWANAPAGSYSLSAKAIDNDGGSTSSAPVSLTVDVPPSIALTSPTANAVFAAPASIPLTASATDSDGTITKVEFYQGTTLIGSATTAPYTATWANVPEGSYSLTAKATDNGGAETWSAAVSVVVNSGVAQLYFLHTDHLNTPRVVTDAQNKVIWRNMPLNEPFGNSPPEDDPDGDGKRFTLNLRFPGQYFDKESNTNYNYFRDYNPEIGRYIQSDPIGLQGGINTYTYVNSQPLSKIDPMGLAGTVPMIGPYGIPVPLIPVPNFPAQSKPSDDGSFGGAFPPGTLPAPINPWTDTTPVVITPANFPPSKGPSDCEAQFDKDIDQCKNTCGPVSVGRYWCIFLAMQKFKACKRINNPAGTNWPGSFGGN